jgi:polyhydroxyalkanoate synthase
MIHLVPTGTSEEAEAPGPEEAAPAQVAPTPRDVVFREGTARLLRFRGAERAGVPLLLVPSIINRWYVLDLRKKVSLAHSLLAHAPSLFCLDWGAPEDEDRYLEWDDVLARLARMIRRVKRETGEKRVALLGYCVGGTLSGVHAAIQPDDVAALVNLAGPFDFTKAGHLGTMTDPRWFDAQAVAHAGNVSAMQMQSGFVALRPTLQLSKWVGLLDRFHQKEARSAFEALETWSSDNIPFPAAAYATYIRELYQENRLVAGHHWARGRRVDLANIRCPVLTIVAEKDNICPPDAATALNDACGSVVKEVLRVPGGHVGAVVGSKAPKSLYPAIADFLRRTLWN